MKKKTSNFVSKREQSRLRSQGGQAILEYLLVLVVIVGIALGVMYQLNSAFKKYVQSYFGEYIACLLETGELPSLGAGDGASAEICNASFEPFSLKNGRPLILSDSGSGSKGCGKRGGSGRSSTSGRAGGSRVTRNRAALNGDRNRGDSVVSASIEKDKKKEVKGSGGGSDSSPYRTQRQRDNGQNFLIGKYKIKEGKKDKEQSKKIENKSKLAASRTIKKTLLDPEKFKRKPAQSDPEIKFSLGQYLRYLIILGLIVMIVVFFGGQLLQLKKSWDRN